MICISIYCTLNLGITSEAGELADAIKKAIIYGKPLDVENIREELGDLLWYFALALKSIDADMSSTMLANIEKLRLRYPEKFTEKDALERKDKGCPSCNYAREPEDYYCLHCGKIFVK